GTRGASWGSMRHRTLHTQKILAGVALVAAHSAPAFADGAPTPPPDEKVAPALIALRAELAKVGEAEARVHAAHFRPLCDERGYPLVGSLMSKGPMYGPSAFCASVRKAKGSS